ncbi:MAG: hypothetical protein M3N22_06445, partial [Acidobacteriota bacterium]|nr:hypothetical protein [Acidobacteriota bacterium]
VMLYDRASGKTRDLSEGFDRSAEGLVWSTDSKRIFFTAENETLSPVYELSLDEPYNGKKSEPKRIVEGFNSTLSLSGDGKALAFERSSLSMPAEVFVTAGDGSNPRQVTHHN